MDWKLKERKRKHMWELGPDPEVCATGKNVVNVHHNLSLADAEGPLYYES